MYEYNESKDTGNEIELGFYILDFKRSFLPFKNLISQQEDHSLNICDLKTKK